MLPGTLKDVNLRIDFEKFIGETYDFLQSTTLSLETLQLRESFCLLVTGVARDCYYQSTPRNTFSNKMRKRLFLLFSSWCVNLSELLDSDFKHNIGRSLVNIKVWFSYYIRKY